MVWDSVVEAATGDGNKLGSLTVKNLVTGATSELEVAGLFFAIGHEPASKFLDGQLETDADGYIVTKPGTADTSIPARSRRKRRACAGHCGLSLPPPTRQGVFACGDVQDKKWRQAITAAGTVRVGRVCRVEWHVLHRHPIRPHPQGCMAALSAEHYIQGTAAGAAH